MGLKIFASIVSLCLLMMSSGEGHSAVKGGKKMELKSAAFSQGGAIPPKYTCDGQDISPALSWSAGPSGTQSFALITDDPDAPAGTWTHWVIWNIPAEERSLPEKTPAESNLPNGAVQGTSSFKKIGYGGPCPPGGKHRYFFKLFALDKKLSLKPGARKEDLLKEMKGHVLGEAQLIGTYTRKQ
jgi:Raf kinase inhibitor-like YbhB/YbcL family protein